METTGLILVLFLIVKAALALASNEDTGAELKVETLKLKNIDNQEVKTELKVLNGKERTKLLLEFQSRDAVESKVAEEDVLLAVDNGYGNPGDLIYRYRESNDKLQIREVIVLPEISSDVQEVQWYAVTQARRITSVRVLNFGRERAYTLRIDVAGNEVQTILRIPANFDPRVMIEVYGR